MHKNVARLLRWLLPSLLLIMSAGCSPSDATTPPTSPISTTDAQSLPPSKQGLIPVSEFLKTNKGVIAFASQGLLDYASYLEEILGILPSSLEENPLEYPNPPTIEIDPSLVPPPSEKDMGIAATRLTTLGAYIEKITFNARYIDVYVVPKAGTFHDIEVDLSRYKNGQHVPVHFIIADEFWIEKVPRRD